MKIFKPLVKDIKNTWPFSNVSFPKSIKCKRAYLSSSGEDFYNGDNDAEGVFWSSVTFRGDYVEVDFENEENDYNGSVKIILKEYRSVDWPSDDRGGRTRWEYDIFLEELRFIQDVLESGDEGY